MKLRFFVCIGLAALLSAPVAAAALEDGFNRPGADYHSFRLSSPDPMVCQDACNRDPKCQSFTYVRPGVQGPQAVCWLKSGVPAPIPHNCCISGLKQNAQPAPAPQPTMALEYGVNRPGGDYTSFVLPGPVAELCRDACARDYRCRAFTFVRAGVQGPDNYCWLKNTIPAPFPAGDCCISGHK